MLHSVANKPKKQASYDLKAADRKRNLLVQIGLTSVVVLFAVALVLWIVLSGETKPDAGEARAVRVETSNVVKNDDGVDPASAADGVGGRGCVRAARGAGFERVRERVPMKFLRQLGMALAKRGERLLLRHEPDLARRALSEQRAQNIARALAARGVPQSALEVQWFGESRPRIPTADGVREPQNRRVEITFGAGPSA